MEGGSTVATAAVLTMSSFAISVVLRKLEFAALAVPCHLSMDVRIILRGKRVSRTGAELSAVGLREHRVLGVPLDGDCRYDLSEARRRGSFLLIQSKKQHPRPKAPFDL